MVQSYAILVDQQYYETTNRSTRAEPNKVMAKPQPRATQRRYYQTIINTLVGKTGISSTWPTRQEIGRHTTKKRVCSTSQVAVWLYTAHVSGLFSFLVALTHPYTRLLFAPAGPGFNKGVGFAVCTLRTRHVAIWSFSTTNQCIIMLRYVSSLTHAGTVLWGFLARSVQDYLRCQQPAVERFCLASLSDGRSVRTLLRLEGILLDTLPKSDACC